MYEVRFEVDNVKQSENCTMFFLITSGKKPKIKFQAMMSSGTGTWTMLMVWMAVGVSSSSAFNFSAVFGNHTRFRLIPLRSLCFACNCFSKTLHMGSLHATPLQYSPRWNVDVQVRLRDAPAALSCACQVLRRSSLPMGLKRGAMNPRLHVGYL
jgi:hypothetical protein